MFGHVICLLSRWLYRDPVLDSVLGAGQIKLIIEVPSKELAGYIVSCIKREAEPDQVVHLAAQNLQISREFSYYGVPVEIRARPERR